MKLRCNLCGKDIQTLDYKVDAKREAAGTIVINRDGSAEEDQDWEEFDTTVSIYCHECWGLVAEVNNESAIMDELEDRVKDGDFKKTLEVINENTKSS